MFHGLSITNRRRASFLLCFLAVGIPYWRIPYRLVSLPDSLFGPALGLVGISACLLVFNNLARPRRATWISGNAVPAAVTARVIVEGIADPTSHNLWPFELVIAFTTGMAVAAAGSLVGWLALALTGRQGKAEP